MTTMKDMISLVLDRGVVNIRFDPRHPGVDVPAHLRRGPELILKFSHYYDAPIDLTEDHISQVLSFQGQDHPCHVPLAAIDAIKVEGHDFQPAPVPQAPRLRLIGDDDE
jgi:stringent starvation protein B